MSTLCPKTSHLSVLHVSSQNYNLSLPPPLLSSFYFPWQLGCSYDSRPSVPYASLSRSAHVLFFYIGIPLIQSPGQVSCLP